MVREKTVQTLRHSIASGWRLVLAAGLLLGIATAIALDIPAIWSFSLAREFGWNLSTLALGTSLTIVAAGFLEPVAGHLTDRRGTRTTVLIGLSLLSLACFLLLFIANVFMFYAVCFLWGLGFALAGFVPLTTMLLKRFARRRTLVFALVHASSGIVPSVMLPVLWLMVESAGWRASALIIGLGIIVLVAPLAALIRQPPEDSGQASMNSAAEHRQITAPRALSMPTFWFLTFGHGILSVTSSVVLFTMASVVSEKGYSAAETASVFPAYYAAGLVFEIVSGYIGDRMSKRALLAVFGAFQAIGAAALVLADSLPLIYLSAVLYGAGIGGIGILTVVIFADYFGTSSLGKILGFSFGPMRLPMVIAPAFAGWMFEALGSFPAMLLPFAGLNSISVLFFLAAAPPGPLQSRSVNNGMQTEKHGGD